MGETTVYSNRDGELFKFQNHETRAMPRIGETITYKIARYKILSIDHNFLQGFQKTTITVE